MLALARALSMRGWVPAQPWQHRRPRTVGAAAAAPGRDRADRYAGVPRAPQPACQTAPAQSSRPARKPPPLQQQQQQHSRGPSSSGTGGSAAAYSEPSAVSSRQWLLQLVPLQRFHVVGVSFDDRQSAISQLRRDQGVACVKEPGNPHDPHAVAVRTLGGRSLGYIPRDQTHFFNQELCFGAVASAGRQGEQGLWGFHITVQPTIPPVEVVAMPASLRRAVGQGLQLSGEWWEALKAATLQTGHGRCALTGSPLAAVHERWAFDDGGRVLRLLGFRLEAPQVQQVGGLLALEGGAAAEATQLLQQLNCWSPQDAETYLAHVRRLAEEREARGAWRLDLRLLQQRGIPVPPALQPLCA